MKKRLRKAVFAVVYKKGKYDIKYLLLKRKLHWTGWEFTKGGLEKGESEIKAVKREVKEESSLKIIKIKKYNIKGSYSYSFNARKERKGYSGQSYSLYSAQVMPGRVKMDKRENSAFKWVRFKKAMKMLKWANQRKCLRIVNKKIIQ